MNKSTLATKQQNMLDTVVEHYQLSSLNYSALPLGNGLINDTYLITSAKKPFVLQRINGHVFQKPWQVTKNADLINQHLSAKKVRGQYPLATIDQLPCTNNTSLLQLESGYWRAIEFIPNSYSIDAVETPEQAEKAARAFAKFNAALSDFPAQNLAEIIPNFHDLGYRLQQLTDATTTNKAERKMHCQDIITCCFTQQDFINEVADLVTKLPVRVTHNDTKINNLLFDTKSHQAIAVIDLDTCMPGYLMHDFGDMVRTCCANLPEDDHEIEKMQIRLDIFKALAKGYISTLNGTISKSETESLIVGALMIPFMMAVRFLTDYLDGDRYFHVQHSQHNLARAKNQLQLFKLLMKQRQQLSDIVHNV